MLVTVHISHPYNNWFNETLNNSLIGIIDRALLRSAFFFFVINTDLAWALLLLLLVLHLPSCVRTRLVGKVLEVTRNVVWKAGGGGRAPALKKFGNHCSKATNTNLKTLTVDTLPCVPLGDPDFFLNPLLVQHGCR